MAFYQLTAEQYLKATPDEAWAFLSDPRNLQRITPDSMNFEICSGAGEPMFPGQVITYKVSPFPGVRHSWVTEITHVREGEYFVDEQRFGPYRFWHHKHFISPVKGGVLMRDVVDYALPLGPLGDWAHTVLVGKKLHTIFSYRESALEARYGTLPGHASSLIMNKLS